MPLLLGDRYRVGERIGTGGSSHVYEAFDERLGRTVAVKLLDEAAAATADPAARMRFESESRTAAQFFHPNVVAVLDAGSDQGSLFLVMELVTGGSLAQRLAEAGPMTSSAVARVGGQLASALAAAHAVGIIHRDVKPSNVLLGADGSAKLADFGIARRFDEIEHSLTSSGMVIGTRHYVSPEQARGSPLGPATDIFSLGVTLYEAATGVHPPSAIDRAPDSRLDVRTIDPTIDAELARVIGRATAIPIEARFADAGQMAGVLAGVATAASRGGTAVSPVALAPRPNGSTPPNSAPEPGVVPAVAMPLVGDRLLDERRHRRRLVRAGVVIAMSVLAIAGLVVAFGDEGDPNLSASATTAPVLSATVAPTTSPATTLGPTTVPATTVAATVAPTSIPTTAATTIPATTSVPIGDELIPGFAVPFDIEDFLQILEADPELAGERGEDLARDLAEVIEGPRGPRPGRRGEAAEKLRKDIQRWTEDGELDPIIAAVAIHYLDELNENTSDDGPRNDDD